MRSLTFVLDTQTGDDAMAPATLTITENADGTLSFTITNEGDGDNLIGDIRGLFFDVADDSLLGTLSTDGADITEVEQDGSVDNLGNGSTVSGVPDAPYEVGIEIGTAGASGDDIQTTSFTLSSSLRALTLDDIALESIAVRQTSVGDADGAREGSDKLFGVAPYPVNAIDDDAALCEDETLEGNVFANDIDEDAGDADLDGIPDGLTVTAVNGDDQLVGGLIELADGITATVGADGSYTIDALDADYLSAGEVLDFAVEYSVDDGNGGSDTATLNITVEGKNDNPEAVADQAETSECSTVSGNVLANDSDIDRLDTISVDAVNGDSLAIGSEITLDSGALLTMNADGTFSYDPNGAFDGIEIGAQAHDSFTYSVTDGNGGTATTVVDVLIEGTCGDGGGDDDDGGDHFGIFTNHKGDAHAISNVVFYLQDEDGNITKAKIDGWDGSYSDLDDLNIFNFTDTFFEGQELVAASIKAGNNHNKDLGPGEGQLFLLDGDEDIDYLQGGVVPAPLTAETLSAKADYEFDYDESLFFL